MNLAEIKEQLSDMQRLVYTHIEPDMYESHVKYLLSIIEQAEKDLKNIEQWFISMCMEGRAESVRDILKSLQGDE